MITFIRRTIRRWLPCLCLSLAFAAPALRATDIIIPLDERLLAHLEKTASGLAVREQGDRELKRDFVACANDKKIKGDTADAFTASISARHPRMTAALTAEDWKPGDFYLAYGTIVSMPFASELSRGGEPDTDQGVRRNVAFYDKHRARIIALIEKLSPLVSNATVQKD